jgi:hypothetical protein
LSSSSLLLELLRDTLELDVVGRERVFVEEERLTLVFDFDELVVLERLTLVLSRDVLVFVLERLTLEFARVLLEFEILLPYFGREPLLLVVEEYDRLDDVVDGRL